MTGREKTRFVTESLANHLRECGFFAATEVPLVTHGAYSSRHRADVYAIKMHEFARKDTRIYEVKTSRADFLNDVNRDKAESYGDYAKRVYYAVPPGIAKKDEIPDGVGLVVLSRNGNWTVQKAPKPGANIQPSADLLLLLMARGFQDVRRVRRLRDREVWEENIDLKDAARNLGHRISLAMSSRGRDHRAERAERLLRAFERVHGKPDVDDAKPGRVVDRSIAASKWEDGLDDKIRSFLAVLDELDRVQVASQFISNVVGRYGGYVNDDMRAAFDKAVKG